jgi:hypothetical protein
MRPFAASGVFYIPGTLVAAQRTAFVESADAPDLERKINAEIQKAMVANPNLLLVFVNLAGGSDGHTFVYELYFGDPTQTFVGGVALSELRFFTYVASSRQELAPARTDAQRRIAAALAAEKLVVPGSFYNLLQTQLTGASQGTRYMGVLTIDRGLS